MNSRRASLPSLSVYVPVTAEQMRTVTFDENDQAMVRDTHDWSPVLETLSAAGLVVTVLFGDVANDGKVRWVGLLISVARNGDLTEVVVAFLTELSELMPISELRQFGTGVPVTAPLEIVPFICISPQSPAHPVRH